MPVCITEFSACNLLEDKLPIQVVLTWTQGAQRDWRDYTIYYTLNNSHFHLTLQLYSLSDMRRLVFGIINGFGGSCFTGILN